MNLSLAPQQISAQRLLRLFSVLTLVLILTSQAFATDDPPLVEHVLTPYDAQGFASWIACDDPDFDHYHIEIMERIADGDDPSSFSTVMSIDQPENYFLVDAQYMNDPLYYYSVSAIDVNGDILIGDQPKPVCTGCKNTLECVWTCNGPTYAYDIELYRTAVGSHYFYLNGGAAGFDQTTNTRIPFYQYMPASAYPGWSSQNPNFLSYKTIHLNVPASKPVYSPTGTPLTGAVVGIEKKKAQFSGYPQASNTLGALNFSCNNPISWAMSTFDSHSDMSNAVRAPLACVPAPGQLNPPVTGGTKITKQKIPSDIAVTFTMYYCNGFYFWTPCDGHQVALNPGNVIEVNNLFDMLVDRDPDFSTGVSSEDEFKVDNYKQFSISRIDQSGTDGVTLDPQNIFLTNDFTVAYPNLDLEKGLYMFNIWFDDDGMLPIYFSYNPDDGQLEEADKTTINIYPVPVSGSEFDVDIFSTETLTIGYTVTDLNGTMLYQDDVLSSENSTTTTSVILSQDPAPNTLLVNQFNFPDGSVQVVTTISE